MDKQHEARVSAAVAETIRAERVAKSLTQDQLADAAGIPHPTYFRYERGIREVPTSRLIAICEALGMPLSLLAKRIEDRIAEAEVAARANE